MKNYILDENRLVVPCDDFKAFGRFFENSKARVVGRTKVGEAEVSTVFLGLDHNWSPSGPPILWETMIFGGPESEFQERCSGTWEDAKAMHQRTVRMLRLKYRPKAAAKPKPKTKPTQAGPRRILK